MRRHFVSGFPRALMRKREEIWGRDTKINNKYIFFFYSLGDRPIRSVLFIFFAIKWIGETYPNSSIYFFSLLRGKS